MAADRLPIPLGKFISDKVYNGKLRSHNIVDYSCIKFVDVRKGNERKKGSSYEVRGEGQIRMVPKLMTTETEYRISAYGRRYHQRGLEFCVITFYDPHRAAIIRGLKAENIPSGCVHNVDGFQGTT
jgi:hypothetical protein